MHEWLKKVIEKAVEAIMAVNAILAEPARAISTKSVKIKILIRLSNALI